MFGIVRLFLFVGLCISLIAVCKKIHKKFSKIKRSIFAVCVSLLIVLLSVFLPFENAFITFSSPEEAINYCYFKSKIELFVEGEKSALAFIQGNNGKGPTLVPRKNEGWGIIGWGDTKVGNRKLVDKYISIGTIRYKNTKDYYVYCYAIGTEEIEISDNVGSVFYSFSNSMNNSSEYVTYYYAYVHNMDSKYSLMINGEYICMIA